MTLSPGTRLGPYEITAAIGAGGMGEVYRATDTALGRQVAIKVLPEAFAHDPERLARFEREARTLAALNHPHIAQIHGFERLNGLHALVMELVEGPTLADLIARHKAQGAGLPVDEALAIAKQIAEALEAAHEQGIIHRDLKPANIKVREDGTVKVLDFGLAKLAGAGEASGPGGARGTDALSQSPTITSPAMMTGVGVILGTAAYMAPEQARGKAVDKRADIWAFGCVLYEMLTGRRVFEAEDVSLTLARVLERDVDLEALPAGTPAGVRAAVRLCLQKDLRRRAQAIGDVRLMLEGAFETAGPAVAPLTPPRAAVGRRFAPWIAALALGMAGGVVGWSLRPAPMASTGSTRLTVVLPRELPINLARSPSRSVVISPNGQRVAYVGVAGSGAQLLVRSLDRLEVSPLTAPDPLLRNPFFSPDGLWVAFFSGGTLKKVRSDGGSSPVTVVEGLTSLSPSGAWTGGDIVYAEGRGGLFRVSADGGVPRALISVGEVIFQPIAVEETGDIVFEQGSADTPDVGLLRPTGERITLLEDARVVALTATGHLLFERNDLLMAAPFDAAARRVGPAVPVPISAAQDFGARAQQVAVSANGTLAYVPSLAGDVRPTLAWVDMAGVLDPIGDLPTAAATVSLCPDGRTAVIGTYRIPRVAYLWDLERRVATRLDVESDNPRCSADGRSVVMGGEGALRLYEIDTGTFRELPGTSSPRVGRPSWTADGRTMALTVRRPTQDIVASTPGDAEPRAIIATDAQEYAPALSPDGGWLAYVSEETGRPEVFLARFPSGGARRQVTVDGGHAPLWSRDGRRLFYLERSSFAQRLEMKALDVVPGETLTLGAGRVLFPVVDPAAQRRSDVAVGWGAGFDLAPDGSRFLMVWDPVQPHTEIVLVQEWFEELRRLVPVE